jgi:hypothetical protein
MPFQLVKIAGVTATSIGAKGDTGTIGATGPQGASGAGVFEVDSVGNVMPCVGPIVGDTFYEYDASNDIQPL